jgi:hypothetical protein
VIGLTGHTSGLGLAISNRYSGQIIGFSRSNGYDISDYNSRLRIIDAVKDCEVFINNAHAGFSQMHMLYELYDSWQDKPRLIINISSNSGDGVKSYVHPYAVYKSALDKASQQLSYQQQALKICNIRFGYIDTPSVSQHDQKKIDVRHACDVICDIINHSGSAHIAELTVLPR